MIKRIIIIIILGLLASQFKKLPPESKRDVLCYPAKQQYHSSRDSLENNYYFKYNNHVYYHSSSNINMNGNDYNHDFKISNSSPDTFKCIDINFAKDKDHVYYHGVLVKKADPESFKPLEWPYAQDKNYYFKETEITQEVFNFIPNILEKTYKNDELGVSFRYYFDNRYNLKEDSGIFYFQENKNSNDIFSPEYQEYVEIYRKEENQNLENAVRKMLSDLKLENSCLIKNIKIEKNKESLELRPKNSFSESECLTNSPCRAYQTNSVEQAKCCEEIKRKFCFSQCASLSCGYFEYQPQNSKNKMFRACRPLLDTPFFNFNSIKLFDNK